jgi:serine/threonine protein kinase
MTSKCVVELAPDSVVGSYRLIREIGRGGMGTVYEAVHTVLPRRAAIKVMHAELRKQPGMATRMVQEAAILEEVRHPGVVRIYECNLLEDHRPWIAMEYVDGETLAARLHYMSKLPPIEVSTLLAEVSDVLASVHARGVVHRDLKPDNLLMTPTDRDFPLRVIDWGVARLGPNGRLTLDGLTPGTPIYMAPEQATGKGVASPCDIYALGVIAYEALVGHPPFDGRTLAEVVCMHMMSDAPPLRDRCDAPVTLCNLVHRMLDKDPSLRPGALEVRQLARSISVKLSSAPTEEHEVCRPAALRIRPPHAFDIPSDEVVVVDPEELEVGVTEMLPIVRKPRWTPEIGPIPGALTELHEPHAHPLATGEDDLGEVILLDKRRGTVS